MGFTTLYIEEKEDTFVITFNRVEHQNSINMALLQELNMALDMAQAKPRCKVVVLKGQNGVFCTGMDFNEAVRKQTESGSQPYMKTLRRLAAIPKIIVSIVDGKVMAGGVGFAAASDLVIATSRAQFSLSEAIWGLLPSVVLPYLIRRIGFQSAYRMTLTTMPVYAEEARQLHLADVVSETPEETLRLYLRRLSRLDEQTIDDIKRYFKSIWIITQQMEERASAETDRLSSEPRVIENIYNYVTYEKFPWQKEE
ncbi:enoyl-CoA hydratase [Enterocloster clostridioformis]|nr:enoyl-CoA hydratase [Lachnoclostridium sp. YL32]NDO27998.1 enoyl-CoA hydratase [Enterocloster clostridioformis]OXE70453.1 enoyl-CoA hydratase [Enterocloster clostridioformis]QQR00605.1 enoyl-CoA hydratase/isomerase family protein [Enterocloster clostridioformis]